jgi:predicted DNA-binding transcriptional regulator YafY
MEQAAIRSELERAIREKKQVALLYRDEGTRTVTPYGLKDDTLSVLIENGARARTYTLGYIHEVRVIE